MLETRVWADTHWNIFKYVIKHQFDYVDKASIATGISSLLRRRFFGKGMISNICFSD